MKYPDYRKYTLNELNDALNHIDGKSYPERVEEIESEITKRKGESLDSTVTKPVEEKNESHKEQEHLKENIFTRYKITDIKSAEKAIKQAWIVETVFSGYLLILTSLAVVDIKFILNEYFTAYSYFDVILTVVIAIGIYRKSRTFAILSVIYIISNHLHTWYSLGESNFGLLDIVLVYFLYKGFLGTLKYHRLNLHLKPKTIHAIVSDRKVCPNCGDKNHNANYRCGCGYEFIMADEKKQA